MNLRGSNDMEGAGRKGGKWCNYVLIKDNLIFNLGVMVYWHMPFNFSTKETEARRSLWIQGQSGLQNEFQDNQSYTQDTLSQKKYIIKSLNEAVVAHAFNPITQE